MNSDTFFNDVILLGRTTVDNELRRHSDKFYNSEVVIDNETCYRIIIEWERCMGEILINRPEFAPYRYVSFNISSISTVDVSPVYYWYDSEDDTLEIIEKKIIEGLEAGFNY